MKNQKKNQSLDERIVAEEDAEVKAELEAFKLLPESERVNIDIDEYLECMRDKRESARLKDNLNNIKAAVFDIKQDYSRNIFNIAIVALPLIILFSLISGAADKYIAMRYIGAAGVLLVGIALIIACVVTVRRAKTYTAYYLKEGSDFICVCETPNHSILYALGHAYEIKNGVVSTYGREYYLNYLDAFCGSLAQFLYAPNGYIEYSKTKRGESFVMLDDLELINTLKIRNGNIESIHSSAPISEAGNGAEFGRIADNKVKFVSVISVPRMIYSELPDNFTVPVSRAAIDLIEKSGGYLDNPRFSIQEPSPIELKGE